LTVRVCWVALNNQQARFFLENVTPKVYWEQYPSRCFYCGETDVFCFEEDHPVTRELDKKFKQVVCRNCHRKREADRDIKGLTKNGQRDIVESENEKQRRYLLLMAEDEDLQAELLQSAPDTPVSLIIAASLARAASLRRKAQEL
jgi:hypothetical protein